MIFENGYIDVNHTLVYYNHRDALGCYFSINTPKTEAGTKKDSDGKRSTRSFFELEKEYQRDTGVENVSRVDGYDDFIFVNRFWTSSASRHIEQGDQENHERLQ